MSNVSPPPLKGKALARQELNLSLLRSACTDAIDLALAVYDDDHHRHLRPHLIALIASARQVRGWLDQEATQ